MLVGPIAEMVKGATGMSDAEVARLHSGMEKLFNQVISSLWNALKLMLITIQKRVLHFGFHIVLEVCQHMQYGWRRKRLTLFTNP